MNTIFTIGHSNRAFSEFVKKLKDNNIETIVDVRTFPRSRFCPQFNRKRLTEELLKHGVHYLFKGGNLGGKAENTEFDETLDELSSMVKQGQKLCIMCSEGDHNHDALTLNLADWSSVRNMTLNRFDVTTDKILSIKYVVPSYYFNCLFHLPTLS